MNSPISSEDRSGVMLAHLSGYAGYVVPCGGVLLPIIILATVKSRTVAAVAKQALYLNVLGLMTVVAAVFLSAPLAMLGQDHPIMYVPVALLALLCVGVIGLVVLCPLIGAVKASGGEYFCYPVFGVRSPDET